MKIKVYESLSDLPDCITRTCSYPSQQEFFLSLDWFSCVYQAALSDSLTPRIYCLLDQKDDVLGVLFCGYRKQGRELVSLTNFYTIKFAPISLSDVIPLAVIVEHIVDYICLEKPRWAVIDLRFLRNDFLDQTPLERIFRRRGFYTRCFFQYENWFLKLAGRTFDTYFAERSSQLRNTIARREKKLRKAHTYEIKIYTKPNSNLTKATKDYIEIYNNSWKNPEPFPTFIPRLITVASELSILRLGILYVNAKPAAAQLWITTCKTATIYKLAYDEKYSTFSPGSILSREMFRQAIDIDNIKEIDYGVGAESYKKQWMESMVEIRGLKALNMRTMKGAFLSVGEAVKSIVGKFRT